MEKENESDGGARFVNTDDRNFGELLRTMTHKALAAWSFGGSGW